MSRACRVQKTCGHADPPPPPARRPPYPRVTLQPPSQEYNMHYAKSVTLMSGLENTLKSRLTTRYQPYSVPGRVRIVSLALGVRRFCPAAASVPRAGEACTLQITPGINHSITGRGRCGVFVMTPRYCSFFSIYPLSRSRVNFPGQMF
ncbi:jg22825 [Pararge aegeria aegeria]|uniref:Jg22825 protein n=1 Tax=Pararge aegeria aegeria TaxID=348720 RepID=A0A8S4S2B5_9NEOP|nr:jg22825 [Pararge aegeria aegeria]